MAMMNGRARWVSADTTIERLVTMLSVQAIDHVEKTPIEN